MNDGPAGFSSPLFRSLLARFHARRPVRVASLVVTVFGDAILPRGGSLWLGTLVEIMAMAGVEPGPVRTALSRLVAQGLVERSREGRSAFHALSPSARVAFEAAAARIWRAPGQDDRGVWSLAVPLPGADLGVLRARLAEAGFTPLGAGYVAAGTVAAPPGVVVVRGVVEQPAESDRASLAATLSPLAEQWRDLHAAVDVPEAAIDAAEAFATRILLVHEFRRLVLREPDWPPGFLPGAWPGHAARLLVAARYAALRNASECWLDTRRRGAPVTSPA